MNPKDRLAKVRSVIRQLEEDMDRMDPEEDQMPLLRYAIVEIIIAAGPQESGQRGSKDVSKREK